MIRAVLILGAILLTGLGVAGVSVVDIWTGLKTPAWPTVEGQVVESRITSGSEGTAHVEYEYEVAERRYRNDRIATGFFFGNVGAILVQRRYPLEKRVRVYYDPDDPGNAVLETGIPASAWVMLVIGLIAAGVGGAGLREMKLKLSGGRG